MAAATFVALRRGCPEAVAGPTRIRLSEKECFHHVSAFVPNPRTRRVPATVLTVFFAATTPAGSKNGSPTATRRPRSRSDLHRRAGRDRGRPGQQLADREPHEARSQPAADGSRGLYAPSPPTFRGAMPMASRSCRTATTCSCARSSPGRNRSASTAHTTCTTSSSLEAGSTRCPRCRPSRPCRTPSRRGSKQTPSRFADPGRLERPRPVLVHALRPLRVRHQERPAHAARHARHGDQ